MNTAFIYQPNNRGLIWIAWICAIVIHLTAFAIRGNKLESGSPVAGTEFPVVIAEDQQQPQPEEISPPEQVPAVVDEEAFPQQNSTPPPVRPHKKLPMAAAVRATGISTTRGMHVSSAKAMALFAPRPAYPYEARRNAVTGSGIAELTMTSGGGNVIDARMVETTGSPILDNATIDALRRWRFKPGVATNIRVPITFTLTGVFY